MFNVWVETNKQPKAVFDWIKLKFNSRLNEEQVKQINIKIDSFCSHATQKWKKNGRSLQNMITYESHWLGMDIVFALSNVSHKGRPTVSYSEGSERQKRRLASEVCSQQSGNTSLLLHAASISTRASKDNDLKYILTEAVKSPTRPKKLKN